MERPLMALTRPRFRRRPRASSASDAEDMRQLIELRWLAVAGQVGTILFVAFWLAVPLPVPDMLAVVAAAAAVNIISPALLRRRPIRQSELLVTLLFDVGSQSLLLYLSGGATNPFVSLFLLQVVLGAILLRPAATWCLVVVTGVSYAWLIAHHLPLVFPPDLRPHQSALMLAGNWICFALIGVLLVQFVTRIIRNLRVRDAHVADLRQQAAEEEHLVRMGLFASGAAHELGTPLATLAVILGDWRRMPRLTRNAGMMEEIDDMQAQVARCKTIVTDVLHSVAELPGRSPHPADARSFMEETARTWAALHPDVILARDDRLPAGLTISADPALRQAIWNLLDNAVEASHDIIEIASHATADTLSIAVRDSGPGFTAEMIADFGRPRQSVKGPGHGVGLFLVAGVVRTLGGTVSAAVRDPRGAEVTIALPLSAIGLEDTP